MSMGRSIGTSVLTAVILCLVGVSATAQAWEAYPPITAEITSPTDGQCVVPGSPVSLSADVGDQDRYYGLCDEVWKYFYHDDGDNDGAYVTGWKCNGQTINPPWNSWNAPPTTGQNTVTVTANDNAIYVNDLSNGTHSHALWTVGVASISPAGPLTVAKGTIVEFTATRTNSSTTPSSPGWPANNPVWGGEASGTGPSTQATFNTVGNRTVTAKCGDNDNGVTVNVVVYDVAITQPAEFPVYEPAGEEVGLVCTVTPSGAATGGSFSWTVVTSPAGASYTLGNGGTATPTFTAYTPGRYVLTVTFSKGIGSRSDTTGDMWYVGIAHIQISADNSYVEGDPKEVFLKGSSYTFTAIKDPTDAPEWPAGTPDWDSSYWGVDRSDNGEHTTVTFTGEYDDRYLTATCGSSANTVTMDVIVPQIKYVKFDGYDIADKKDWWGTDDQEEQGDNVACFKQGYLTYLKVKLCHPSKTLSFSTYVEIRGDVNYWDESTTGGDYCLPWGTIGTSWNTEYSLYSTTFYQTGISIDDDVDMQFQYRVSSSFICMGNVENSKYYLVLDTPCAPMAEPWSDVLDLACAWADGETTESGVVNAMTTCAYNCCDRNYDGGRTHSAGTTFDLTRLFADNWADCRDMSALVHVFTRAIGGSATQVRQIDDQYDAYEGFYYKAIDPVGNPSWSTGWWNFHQVACFGGGVYDACLRLKQSDPRIPCGEDVDGSYKTDLYDPSPPGEWTPMSPFSYEEVQ